MADPAYKLIMAMIVCLTIVTIVVIIKHPRKCGSDHYLIAPYLDLENPDGNYRGSGYALSEFGCEGYPR